MFGSPKRGGAAITVGVDLQLMQPAGATGGVKPLVFSFLREVGRQEGDRMQFVFFASSEFSPELAPLIRAGDTIAAAEPSPAIDVLYAPFGRSAFMRPGQPTVSLIVDLLHRDLPDALPIEEVNFRHEWFTQVAAYADYLQCISRYTAERLRTHYRVDAERCFVTYLPVHRRLAPIGESGATTSAVEGPFFFYPANFWPHKNHETLLSAYQLYRDTGGSEAWPLVLTGHPDARMQTLVERAAALGLGAHVQFLGHLSEPEFAATWRSAGALVYPSLHEGFGIPLVEAMAFGVPIIASEATSLPEVGGDACVYVDPREPSSIAAAFGKVATDEALRRRLIARGAGRLQAFSLECEAARLADYLRRAAVGRVVSPSE